MSWLSVKVFNMHLQRSASSRHEAMQQASRVQYATHCPSKPQTVSDITRHRRWTASHQHKLIAGLFVGPTMRGDLKHLPTRSPGLLVQLCPQDRGGLCRPPSLAADLNLVLGDIVIQPCQEVLRQVVPAVDTPVVADELTACHLFGHLQSEMGNLHLHL